MHPEHIEVVPCFDDLPILHADHAHASDVHRLACRLKAHPVTSQRAGGVPPHGHAIVLFDQVINDDLEIGKAGEEGLVKR